MFPCRLAPTDGSLKRYLKSDNFINAFMWFIVLFSNITQ